MQYQIIVEEGTLPVLLIALASRIGELKRLVKIASLPENKATWQKDLLDAEAAYVQVMKNSKSID